MSDHYKVKTLPAKAYEPSPHDRKAMQAYVEEQRKNPPPPRLKAVKEEAGTIGLVADHPDFSLGQVLLLNAIGVKDPTLGRELLAQMAFVANGEEDKVNAMIAFVRGLQPRDSLEATLATQMATTHALTMNFARRLNNAKNVEQQDSAERALNKLARTFTTQMEALKRYRTGGQQKVTVEHVHVHEGGQAIVGHVVQKTGGGRAKKK
jgi:hypothetical protein